MANNTVAYGFFTLEAMFSQRAVAVGIPQIYTAVQQSAAEHTRQINALLASIAEQTVGYKERLMLSNAGTLQPLDEAGVPLPVKPGGYYDVAYPIQGGGTAWGTNRVTRAKMTVDDANRFTLQALMADADWMRRHMLAALFYASDWTFSDVEHGDLTIKPLANNDAATYVRVGGSVSTDNHYLAQAAAIADATNPYPTIYDELAEHPSNSGAPIVAYIPTNLVATTTGLAAFVPVRDADVVPAAADASLVGSLDRGFGDEVLGKVGKTWVIEWKSLPDSYILGHARASRPLKMRQHPEPELQGLNPENFSPDGNHLQTSLIRYAGFGVADRVGALIYRIGNADYAAPAGYTAMPLSV